MPRILIIEDDPTVAEVVTRYLVDDGFVVDHETDGEVGLAAALADPPELVLLDGMLPSLDGFEVCRRLRALTSIPVILLTARGDETDRIIGLDLGADDYVAKPFSPGELVARVRAVLRRVDAPPPAHRATVMQASGLEIDLAARVARRSGLELRLTAREFELLAYLVAHPGRAFRRDELLEAVWGYRFGDASTVTVHVRRLREKIERDPSTPDLIATVWGVGYRWDGA
jgi:DNA-binding response OmpR family regulator